MRRTRRHLLTAATVAIVLVPTGGGHGPANAGEDRRAVVRRLRCGDSTRPVRPRRGYGSGRRNAVSTCGP